MLGLRSPLLAFVGLLVIGKVGLGLWQGSLGIQAAAERVLVVAVVLAVVERFLVPVARAAVGGPKKDV